MNIRNLNRADLKAMTQIARHGLEFEEITEPLILEKTFASKDYTPELSVGCEINGELAGFAVASMGTAENACVRLLVVSPQHRRQNAGSLMLKTLEERLSKLGAKSVSFGDCPINYLTPGMDTRYTEGWCFLMKHKYEKKHTNHDLIAPLHVNLWPELPAQIEALTQEGYEIRRARQGDQQSIYRLLDTNWPGWRNEVDNSFENDPISIHIATKDGVCLAFSGYQGNNRDLAWFGPMGTDPATRGKGIGGVLLRLCLLDMARQGFTKAIIPWVGPIRFYSRYADAKIDRVFYVFAKQL